MRPKENDIITARVLEDLNYGFVAEYSGHRIFIDFSELSWKSPVPNESTPKVGDSIKIIIKPSNKQGFEFIGSVRAINPEKNPWYNPSVYVKGDTFTGEIEEIHSFGAWALHPKGAHVRILKDLRATNLKVGSKIEMRISEVREKNQILDGEIIEQSLDL